MIEPPISTGRAPIRSHRRPAAISATAGPTPVAPNRKANSTVVTPRSFRSASVSAGSPNWTSEMAICEAIAQSTMR